MSGFWVQLNHDFLSSSHPNPLQQGRHFSNVHIFLALIMLIFIKYMLIMVFPIYFPTFHKIFRWKVGFHHGFTSPRSTRQRCQRAHAQGAHDASVACLAPRLAGGVAGDAQQTTGGGWWEGAGDMVMAKLGIFRKILPCHFLMVNHERHLVFHQYQLGIWYFTEKYGFYCGI